MAVVTGLGPDLATTWQGLLEGRTAIRPVTRFAPDRYATRYAACIEGLEPEQPDGSRLWPLLEQAAVQLALPPKGARLFTATTKGSIDVLERLRRGLPADPTCLAIPDLLPRLARRLGLADHGVNINAACASSTIALARGAAAIAAGRAEAVVVCCMDLVSEFVFSGFSALRASPRHPASPSTGTAPV